MLLSLLIYVSFILTYIRFLSIIKLPDPLESGSLRTVQSGNHKRLCISYIGAIYASGLTFDEAVDAVLTISKLIQ